MNSRRRARITALQALFEIDAVEHAPVRVVAQRLIDRPLPATAERFTRRLIFGVLNDMLQLDEIISRHAPRWPVEDMSMIDRNILRIALYELRSEPDTPVKVIIDEAVELAKTFGTDNSPRFVNGVLGSIVASAEEEGLPAERAVVDIENIK